jgi:hypothetical protein
MTIPDKGSLFGRNRYGKRIEFYLGEGKLGWG